VTSASKYTSTPQISRPLLPYAPPPSAPSPGSIPFGPTGGGGGSMSIAIPIIGGSTVKLVVPPGGFAGFAQQTPATQALFQRSGRVGGKRSAAKRKRAKKTAARAAPKRRRKRAGKKARLVKGSAAAKRYMASIRRKRKK